MKKLIFYILLTLFVTNNFAQEKTIDWVHIDKEYGNNILININELSPNDDNEFYVWAIEENDPPITLEGIKAEIYATKTLYLINKNVRKYNLSKIIYYDKDGQLIKQFSYEINNSLPQKEYSYPIYSGSDVDFILAKSLEYIGNTNEK